MHNTRREFLGAAAAPLLTAAQSRQDLKLFVLWDMEGTSGVFTREQAWYWENRVRPEIAEAARRI
jgi:hypothetical protein